MPLFSTVLILLHFFPAAAIGATQDADARLAEFRKAYELEEERLVADKLEAVQDIRRRYLEAVKSLAGRKQAAGELEPLLLVRQEIERFNKNPEVEPADLAKSVPELLALQEIYMQLRAEADVDYWQGALKLADKSDLWLERFQRELTRGGRLEPALEVKKERSKLAGRRKAIETRLTTATSLSESLQKKDEPAPAVEDKEFEKPRTTAINKPTPSEEKWAIAERYRQFYRHLLADRWDSAVKYVNPEDVERKGTDALKLQLRFISGISKLARGMEIRRIGTEVTLQDAEHAVVVPQLRVRRERKDGQPVRWVKINGQWYVDVD